MKKIIIITGNELRHDFFRKYIASEKEILVVKSYCEVPNKDLSRKVREESYSLRDEHLKIREQTEIDFFESFCFKINDNSNPEFGPKGFVNSVQKVNEIIELNPDLIISFGCSIIKDPLINKFKRKFINIHLGLSPYYRGSGTNFFPLVNNQVECVGVTFMHIDSGIDTGEIIHQMRPTISCGDNIHQIGNRLIKEMAEVTNRIILNFESLVAIDSLKFGSRQGKYYRSNDFSETSVSIMYDNFSKGIIKNYIENKERLNINIPILENPAVL